MRKKLKTNPITYLNISLDKTLLFLKIIKKTLNNKKLSGLLPTTFFSFHKSKYLMENCYETQWKQQLPPLLLCFCKGRDCDWLSQHYWIKLSNVSSWAWLTYMSIYIESEARDDFSRCSISASIGLFGYALARTVNNFQLDTNSTALLLVIPRQTILVSCISLLTF